MRIISVIFLMLIFTGCSSICQFGTGASDSPTKCHSIFDRAEVGMTLKEVEDKLGVPSKRQLDVTYRNTRYGEVWVYESDPPTVLYFKNGVLDKVEYQESGF
ncbi:MAG TPA: hypothetical protein PLU24_00305 [Candidatus Omnitrophota bacterium]|nr:hypothetical protein [Candidatus Omnitrophota bacterium]